MTNERLIKGVQAHFADDSSTFKTRIQDSIPIGIELFVAENQWEFLDVYLETTSEVASNGKTRIALPDDWYKPVHIWTDRNPEMGYIDRKEWGERQMGGVSAQPPGSYTQIGKNLFLDRPSSGGTIYCVYTQSNSDIDLPDLPFQYHSGIMLGVIWFLTPGMFVENNQRVQNPAKKLSWNDYQERVRLAMSQELSIKGRVRRLRPDPVAQRRNLYR